MPSIVKAEKNRKFIRDFTILDTSSEAVVPAATDVVRVKIGRKGQAPILDLDSAANSSNGSSVSPNSPTSGKNRVQIVQDDMDLFSPGVYTLELGLVDDSDDDAFKHADSFIFFVENTMTGDEGLT